MEEFKLNYYFNEYKDKPFKSSRHFRNMFIKKNGKFQGLDKLVVMIYNYQVKKFGQILLCGIILDTKEEIERKKINSKQRERYRLNYEKKNI